MANNIRADLTWERKHAFVQIAQPDFSSSFTVPILITQVERAQ
jgi:hypothetical protein